MLRKVITLILIANIFIVTNCFANLPLRYQLTKSNQLAIESNFTYAPTYQITVNNDLLNLDNGLKYGFTDDLEGKLSIGYFANFKSGMDDSRERGLSGIKASLAYMLLKEDTFPGINLFFETPILDNKRNINGISQSTIHFNSWHLGTVLYHTNDPVIISLKLGYLLNIEKPVNEIKLKESDLFYIQPMVDFIVNPDIILFSGFSINKWGKSYIENQVQTIERSELLLNMGFKYAFNNHFRLSSQLDFGTFPVLNLTANYDF